MSNTIRITTTASTNTTTSNDNYIKVNLKQDFDFIEILSLNISQNDAYIKFCSDYGVVVGRVMVNNGFGVPNAKVSIFIPIDDVDKQDPVISGLYPYETVTDTDSNGIRYTLFPQDPDPTNPCSTPIGTFPTKRQVLDNDNMLYVYNKYYKFTTTTNFAGDYMFFGVPIGTYTIHIDADISNIGVASQRPYDLVSQGVPTNKFAGTTKFNSSSNIDTLVQVKTLNAGVNIQPFWGDTENCEIGIVRQDFNLNYNLVPYAMFTGSIFGDNHKHSVNKRCRPRDSVGEICEQVAGAGTIYMIRKTLDGQIEQFDVNGGDLIDDNGTWAYQIPMNLDYMKTAEDGSLVLSNDPNVGIPTRARVRFNIGMNETGGEGRLRTRARYLVPNNPQNQSDIDYSFDETTLDSSFINLYWNKIYTVSNYITRFQRNNLSGEIFGVSRSFLGIKNTDGCGSVTPFPYNRVSVTSNILFSLMCFITWIFTVIVSFINFIVYVINLITCAINKIFDFVNNIVSAISTLFGGGKTQAPSINSIPCITLQCPAEDPTNYTPGCVKTECDNNSPTDSNMGDYVNCVAAEMATSLDMYTFDFYNDWINGSLYGFLLKYKHRQSGQEFFCEYDCRDFTNSSNYTGVNGDGVGGGDNTCFDNILIDTCLTDSSHAINSTSALGKLVQAISLEPDNQKDTANSGVIRDGLIKSVNGELFYASTKHDAKYKLYATDIVLLGSVFKNDWQGVPNIQPYLIPTTYKLPPLTDEVDPSTGNVDVNGMFNPQDANNNGLFFSVDCLGVHVNPLQCLNSRHICEYGVDINEAKYDSNGNYLSPPTGTIGIDEISDGVGKFVRDSLVIMNGTIYGVDIPSNNNYPMPSNGYNLQTYFEPVSKNNQSLFLPTGYDFINGNGSDYNNFRGYDSNTNQSGYFNTKKSYYYYFGLIPGNTALDKLNKLFFTKCQIINKDQMVINILDSKSTTTSNSSDGSLTFSIVGGVGPFTWSVTNASNIFNGTATSLTSNNIILNNLIIGEYTVQVIDSLGTVVTKILNINGPQELTATAVVSSNAINQTQNGVITIISIVGGVSPYSYVLTNGINNYNSSITSSPLNINVKPDNNNPYKLTISDSSTPQQTFVINGLTVTSPTPLIVNVTGSGTTCYNGSDGKMYITPSGGQPPYTYTITGPNNFSSSDNYLQGLLTGTYNIVVTDSANQTSNTNYNVSEPNSYISLQLPTNLGPQCDPLNYNIPIIVKNVNVNIGSTIEITYITDSMTLTKVINATYNGNNNVINISIPTTDLLPNGTLSLYCQYSTSCQSNTLTISQKNIILPNIKLTASINNNPNSINSQAIIIGGVGPYSSTYNSGLPTPCILVSNNIYDLGQTFIYGSNVMITDSLGCTVTIQF